MGVVKFVVASHHANFSIDQVDEVQLVLSNDDNNNNNSSSSTVAGVDAYDDKGALYYVIAVVFIYGFSIILMIGSTVKRKGTDGGVNKYLKDLDNIRRLERRQEKFKTRLIMQQTVCERILGSDKAEIQIVPKLVYAGGKEPEMHIVPKVVYGGGRSPSTSRRDTEETSLITPASRHADCSGMTYHLKHYPPDPNPDTIVPLPSLLDTGESVKSLSHSKLHTGGSKLNTIIESESEGASGDPTSVLST